MISPYYQDNNVTIYNCRYQDIINEIGRVDCCVTSPPYNLINENSNLIRLRGKDKNDEWYDDDIPEEEYQRQQKELINSIMGICNGSLFYNHKNRYAIARRGKTYSPMEWIPADKLWCEIIWDRCGTTTGNVPRFHTVDERIYMIGKPKTWNNPNSYNNIWRFPPSPSNGHACPFPIEIPLRCISCTTIDGDMILDPYAGSCTTGRAAKDLNRKCICIEKEERYAEIGAKRMLQECLF